MREAISNIPKSETSVKQLHVFSVNGGYYPLSFLLKATKAHLVKIYQFESSNLSNEGYGARATLSNFAKHPPKFTNNLTPEEWEKVYNEGLQNTKLDITFFAGFLDILKALFDQKPE